VQWLNQVIVVGYLAYVVVDGVRRSKDTHEIGGTSWPTVA